MATAAEGARRWSGLAWLGTALFERLGAWSADGADPSSAPALASLGRRLGEHVAWWQDLVPDSVLLAGDVHDGPVHPGVADLVAALDGVPAADRLAVAGAVADGLVADLERLADDLDADSLALIELVEALEEELSERSAGFRIEDDDLEDLRTVRDAVDYVVARLG